MKTTHDDDAAPAAPVPAGLCSPGAIRAPPEGVRASLAAASRTGAPLYSAGDAAGCTATSRPV